MIVASLLLEVEQLPCVSTRDNCFVSGWVYMSQKETGIHEEILFVRVCVLSLSES